TGTLYMCLGREDSADLRAPLRASKDDTLLDSAIDEAIGRKPKGHDFIIDREHNRPAIARHMSLTGGSQGSRFPQLPSRPGQIIVIPARNRQYQHGRHLIGMQRPKPLHHHRQTGCLRLDEGRRFPGHLRPSFPFVNGAHGSMDVHTGRQPLTDERLRHAARLLFRPETRIKEDKLALSLGLLLAVHMLTSLYLWNSARP